MGGIVYDYLLENQEDTASIKILSNLSKFEEIDIPQTLEFAELLTVMLSTSTLDSTIIVSNLISILFVFIGFPKYQSLFRDRLLEVGYI